VISVVSKGTSLSWMDTTPEVTAMGYLMFPLRAKPALVILPDNVDFQTTPTASPTSDTGNYTIDAKLDADGVLQAKTETKYQGDSELYYRYAFRKIPEAQWKDFAQKNFYGGILGGTISSVRVSSPEKTEEPFTVAYDYTIKDFAGGNQHRFVVPFSCPLPDVRDSDLDRTTPLWIGYSGESLYEFRVELPLGLVPAQQISLDLKESFAEYQTSAKFDGNVLIVKRRLLLKENAVTPDQVAAYKAFQKAISNNCKTYVYLRTSIGATQPPSSNKSLREEPAYAQQMHKQLLELPDSSNAEALTAETDARTAIQKGEQSTALASLQHAVALDPHFSRAWIELGSLHASSREKDLAIESFQKGVDADPKQVFPYKILAFAYMAENRNDEAVAVWHRLQAVAPDDSDIVTNLGPLFFRAKRYKDAVALYESAAKASPDNASIQVSLGLSRIQAGETASGLAAIHRAVELDSTAAMLNNVAYEMSEIETDLQECLTYSQRSIKEVEEKSQKVDLANVSKEDLQRTVAIAAYWDTLGWIYFKMGDIKMAEPYLNSAWQLAQDGAVADHLGQLYEKQHKLPEALHMYNLALEVNRHLTDTQARMRNLAHVHLPAHRMSAAEELSEMRTIRKLSKISSEQDFAELYVLVGPNGKIEKANFNRGSLPIKESTGALLKATFDEPLPPGSTAHLLRRGSLSCNPSTGCSFVFYSPAVAAERD
jgi:tetratricopeptide (TPR) repeat protein